MNDSTTPVQGNDGPAGQLFALLYDELRARARDQARRNSVSPLNTTTLVHECYLRLAASGRLQIEDQRHFLAYAITVMRSIVVDFARANLAEKRGGHGVVLEALSTDVLNSQIASDDEVVRMHEALEELAALDTRLAKVVEMRYFGGLTEREVAEALSLTTRTVQRDWEKARLLLGTMLKDSR